MKRSSLAVVLLATVLAACAPIVPLGPQPGVPVRKAPSPNFDARRPNLVVLHHTSDSTVDEALATLTSPERKVSAHYLVGRGGEIVQLVEEKDRAWHAGKSWWGGNTDVNSASIGIELDNDGFEPFAEAQIDALLVLLADIQQRHGIPGANFVGHADVAPDRKADPSAWFPWQTLADHGFGLWCDVPVTPAPAGFDLALALTALGYSPVTPEASRHAFRLHYFGERAPADEEEKALAFCLVTKKAATGNGAGVTAP